MSADHPSTGRQRPTSRRGRAPAKRSGRSTSGRAAAAAAASWTVRRSVLSSVPSSHVVRNRLLAELASHLVERAPAVKVTVRSGGPPCRGEFSLPSHERNGWTDALARFAVFEGRRQ